MYGLGDMLEVVENLSFPNPESLGNLPQVQGFLLEGRRNFLP
jgi:hypothetical protein